jgi:diadenosine tetraphosphate (Ap4A) HIT family hydrolase
MPASPPLPESDDVLSLPVFGLIEPERVVAQDDLFAVIRDKFPVSPGHSLIIPRRAVARFQDLTGEEQIHLLAWINRTQKSLAESLLPQPDAFNFGLNDGPAAGQTMPQLHFHIIPRYAGDLPDPRGGVRWIIPARARYW